MYVGGRGGRGVWVHSSIILDLRGAYELFLCAAVGVMMWGRLTIGALGRL